jgi:hypothetical protein
VAAAVVTRTEVERDALRHAILLTLAYADLFDYPLSRAEIHRYLIGCASSVAAVREMLEEDAELHARLERTGDWFHLPGRRGIVETRRFRMQSSAQLRAEARPYVGAIVRLPLVRFVAVTGALAMDNAEPGADVDLFILARPGRLWLCRLLVLAVVRIAALRGRSICPNFMLSTDQLALRERNLFTAHEFAQLAPIEQTAWYHAFRAANSWTLEVLPNARDGRAAAVAPKRWLSRIASDLLATTLFDPIERWEMDRKLRRLGARARREGGNVAFTKHECRGHFAAHDATILAAFAARAADIEGAT